MANVKISELPTATAVAPTDTIPVLQAGVTKQAKWNIFQYLSSAIGAVTRTLFSKLAGGMTLSLEDFGGGPTKTAAENYTAWQAAFAALPTPNGGTIQFEAADLYDFSTTLTGDGTKRVTIVGRGSGSQGTTGTRLRFPAGVGGINLKNGASGFGGRSKLKDLRVIGQDVGVGTNDGLLMQANSFVIDDVFVSGFGRHGCYVYSSAVNDDTINANTFLINKLACYSNFVNGFKAEGANSNAGEINGLDCSLNTDWGVYDLAVLGNTYIGPHVASCTAGGYRLGALGSRVRIFGGYKEDDGLPGVQIDLGSNGWHDLNFLEMKSSFADNATQKSRFTAPASSEVGTNRFTCGIGNNQYVVLLSTGVFIDQGLALTMRNAAQNGSWDMSAQNDFSLRVRQVSGTAGATINLQNPLRLSTPANAVQSSASVFAGPGVPSNADGSNGDFYFRSDGTKAGATCIYHKEAGAWVALI